MPKVIGIKLPDEEAAAFQVEAKRDGYRTVAAWMRALAKRCLTPVPDKPKARSKQTPAPSQTEGYIEVIKSSRPMPPDGLSRSDLQRWYRANR